MCARACVYVCACIPCIRVLVLCIPVCVMVRGRKLGGSTSTAGLHPLLHVISLGVGEFQKLRTSITQMVLQACVN